MQHAREIILSVPCSLPSGRFSREQKEEQKTGQGKGIRMVLGGVQVSLDVGGKCSQKTVHKVNPVYKVTKRDMFPQQ